MTLENLSVTQQGEKKNSWGLYYHSGPKSLVSFWATPSTAQGFLLTGLEGLCVCVWSWKLNQYRMCKASTKNIFLDGVGGMLYMHEDSIWRPAFSAPQHRTKSNPPTPTLKNFKNSEKGAKPKYNSDGNYYVPTLLF